MMTKETTPTSWMIYNACVFIAWISFFAAIALQWVKNTGDLSLDDVDRVNSGTAVVFLSNAIATPILSVFGIVSAFNCHRRNEKIPRLAKCCIVSVIIFALLAYGYWTWQTMSRSATP